MSSKRVATQTKTEILDAAWDLVSRRGADVSVSDIAKQVGISRQSIYLHFGSRGGLLIALVRRADDRFDIKTALFDAFALPDPQARLERTLDVWLDFVPKIYPVAKDLIRLRDTDAESAAAWEDRMQELRSWLAILFTSLEADGVLPHGWTARDASEVFWAHSSVQVWGLLTSDCGWSADKARRHLRQFLVSSMVAKRG
ncbi:TetR/AcrR family transcriptional regulator [uncultured Tateyamaria sp.]|uniref:TetR/AcrR family transcriptional regulator n=1 Tax=Tateyamaria sp. 1078 TaxID=3417464 RepID=UPI002606B7DE|nr:TetR/AcrR family transcriptional regulator [uncultured Tateyamaria sp.]